MAANVESNEKNITAQPAAAGSSRDLFGHPRGLTVLGATEFWERFSFYGMQAVLLLYLTKYLLLPEHAIGVWGLAKLRTALESLSGPLTDIGFAAQIYGIYNALIYLMPLAGAWLGDRVLGRTRTVTIGCLLMSAGHLAMAMEPLFLVALALLILGAGCLTGNMAAQVGMLYAPEDERRSRAYQVYYIMLNLGALIAPLLVGTLAEKVNWHLGFGVAGIGMLIGLASYLAGLRHLPPDRIATRAEHAARVRLNRADWRRVAVLLLLLFGPYFTALVGSEMAYSIMYVWADTQVDRVVLGFETPVTWIGVVDGLLAIMGVFVANLVAKALLRRGIRWSDLARIGTGLAIVAVGWVFAAGIATLPVTPLLLWLAFFVFLDFGTALVGSTILAVVSRSAPQASVSMMMAAAKVTFSLCYLTIGWLGQFYEPLGPPKFWLLTGGIVAVGALLMLGLLGWWQRGLGTEVPPAAAAA